MDAQTAVSLTQAIRDHSGMEMSQIREAGEHGADAGWPGFTYTKDGADFTDANAALLDEMLQLGADDFGHDDVAAFVASFNRSDMADTLDGYKCLVAWYALEECGRFWSDRAECRA
jgi:hypothetical protein